jgi:plasmid stabilization system protein ParE
MVKIVKLNQVALSRINAVAEYLETEYSNQTATNFVESVYATIEKISEHPTRGRTVPNSKTLQFLNIDKYRQVFYRVRHSTLVIVDIFDTRQHPSKRPK